MPRSISCLFGQCCDGHITASSHLIVLETRGVGTAALSFAEGRRTGRIRGLPNLAPSAVFPAFLGGESGVGPTHMGQHQPGDGSVSARPGFVRWVENIAGAPHYEAPGRTVAHQMGRQQS